jgi:hypothetical protein
MPLARCKNVLIAVVLVSTFAVCIQANWQSEKDPDRPLCKSSRCQKIRAFLMAHYCGKSPFGNGPEDSCDTRGEKKPGPGTKVIANYVCKENETDGTETCLQRGKPSPRDRSILIREMRRIGLPAQRDKEVHFTVLENKSSGWSLMAADYDHVSGTDLADLTICEVIVVSNESGRPHVLHKVPFQKTSANESNLSTWSPVDIADVDGDGHMEFVLEGDALEDHWLEVVGVQDGYFKTIFSGLGYYL